jgi:hypothetical protein
MWALYPFFRFPHNLYKADVQNQDIQFHCSITHWYQILKSQDITIFYLIKFVTFRFSPADMLLWKEKIKTKNVSSLISFFKDKANLLLPEDSIVHTHVLVLNHKHVCRHSWTKATICLYRQILFSEHGNWNIKLNHTFYKYVQATVCLFWPRVQETLSEAIVYCLLFIFNALLRLFS